MWYNYDINFRGARGLRQIGKFWTSNLLLFFFVFVKENWIYAMTRHHAESNIDILLTRNLPFDSGVRQWSHPLMMPLRCLCAKSSNRTRGQFEHDVTWFCFCFDFVHSLAWCCCCSIVCWRSGRGDLFKIGRPRSRGWKMVVHRWTRGMEGSWKLNSFHGRHMCIVPNIF